MINVGRVAMVPLESVTIGDRAREVMGDLNELEGSLKEIGLISPLAVKETGSEQYQLLAGERRFRVLQRDGVDTIPVRIYSADLTELESLIVEKSENFFRKDFEYWEYDRLVADIHKMQQELHGEKAPGPGHEKGWSVSDTGDMEGVSKGAVSTAIKRNQARELFPELFEECKTQHDATKLMKKMDEALVKEELARRIEMDRTDSTLVRLSKNFIQEDFFKGVRELPAGIMHLVEIDPPYGIDLNKQKKSDGESKYTTSEYNEIPADDYQVFLAKVFQECYRVMADHSWLICWYAPEPWAEIVYRELNNAGFSTTRMCGIWTKPTGQTMQPDRYLANSYEMFYYAWKGRPVINKAGSTNIFNIPPIPPQQKVHPTERPIDLMQSIYNTFAFTGSRVLIPFLGSGNGLLAAYNLGMTAVGFELSKSFRDSFLVKVNNIK